MSYTGQNYFQIVFKDKVIPIHDKGAHSKFIKKRFK